MIGAPSSSAEALRIQPIIGWRAWYVCRDRNFTPQLWSVVHALPWPSGSPLVAHALPTSLPKAGIYAYRSPELAVDEFASSDWGGGLVLGSVALWGTVVEHERGYRAQYAYPQELLLPLEPWDPRGPWADPDAVRALARAYGAEVRPLADIIDFRMTVAVTRRHHIQVNDEQYLVVCFGDWDQAQHVGLRAIESSDGERRIYITDSGA